MSLVIPIVQSLKARDHSINTGASRQYDVILPGILDSDLLDGIIRPRELKLALIIT